MINAKMTEELNKHRARLGMTAPPIAAEPKADEKTATPATPREICLNLRCQAERDATGETRECGERERVISPGGKGRPQNVTRSGKVCRNTKFIAKAPPAPEAAEGAPAKTERCVDCGRTRPAPEGATLAPGNVRGAPCPVCIGTVFVRA